jgi:hypothetical protein
VCAATCVDDDDDADEENDGDTAACVTSSSRSVDTDFDAVDVRVELVLPAVADVLGTCAANHAPRPRNDAALTAPVIRRARRAGCGFFVVRMVGACARRGKRI